MHRRLECTSDKVATGDPPQLTSSTVSICLLGKKTEDFEKIAEKPEDASEKARKWLKIVRRTERLYHYWNA